MNRLCRNSVRPVMTILALACAFSATAAPDGFSSDPLTTPDASGWLRTFTPAGTIDTGNPFFQSLGTNGRSCNSCHRQAEGWTVTPAELQQRFEAFFPLLQAYAHSWIEREDQTKTPPGGGVDRT